MADVDIVGLALGLIPRLRRYARLLTGQASSADDLVQDTLERALRKQHLWRAPEQGDEVQALKSWLLQMMHNLYLNQLRSQQPHLDMEELGAWEPSYQPHRELEGRMDLERALASMPAAGREVLLLVCVEEMSYEQAAQVLQVPVGTVMSRLSRARQRLHQAMEAGGSKPQGLRAVP
ncbi:RNA polymerase sigma factor [Curvibacter sp. CHRR-16]|uniref:RNA polymerase sigma factor n=1 Tax=Curvibacter sp. CHRR-16 TaxID=2835872 RepID=UPI001BD92634|nr:RNA polymerase sigma factor [Curvibacter sp. CHRR-16]MBT0570135.1 RNA polymerase sigma factor [Curvibacter sp. CHRR-16]